MMNILIEMLSLFEDKSDYVAKTFGEKLVKRAKSDSSFKMKSKEFEAEDVVNELVKADPSKKHIVWIARMYIDGQYKMEDVPRMKDELDKFNKYKNKLEKKDLNNFKSLDELYAALDKIDPSAELAAAEAAKALKTAASDATWLVRTKDYMALIPKTKEASCKYGAGTRWCTAAAGNNLYDSYARRGDLIIIMAKIGDKTRKFQFHFESDSFMDENDRPISSEDRKAISRLPAHLELVEKLIDIYFPDDDEDEDDK